MPGLELIGPEERKEVMDVMETGVLMRYGFDNERKGVFKVRQFEEEICPLLRRGIRPGGYVRFRRAQDRPDCPGCRPRR